jgi:hypothetical protein
MVMNKPEMSLHPDATRVGCRFGLRTVGERNSPPQPRRGGCAIKKMFPFLSGADGVVLVIQNGGLRDDLKGFTSFDQHHPVAPITKERGHCLSRRATPPLLRRGIARFQIHE